MSGALRVTRYDSGLGSWELVSRAPDPRLHTYVGDYEGYVETGAPPLRQQVPAPFMPVIVNFGSRWNIAPSADGPYVARDSFVAGLGSASVYVEAAGPASCVQANLTPLGAYSILGFSLHELANEVVALEAVLPPALRHLADQLEEAATWEQRFSLLDTFFVARLADARKPSPDVAWAWNILVSTHGKAPIGWICDTLGRSRRHLASRFREQIGLPPKTVARILRFDRAVSLLRHGDPLADVAFECGYFDQAHLNRDFREFTGTAPGTFARRMVPDGGVVV